MSSVPCDMTCTQNVFQKKVEFVTRSLERNTLHSSVWRKGRTVGLLGMSVLVASPVAEQTCQKSHIDFAIMWGSIKAAREILTCYVAWLAPTKPIWTQWKLHAPTDVIFSNTTFCARCVFLDFVSKKIQRLFF